VATIRQYLDAGLIDALHVAIAPRLLGSGEHLLYGLDLTAWAMSAPLMCRLRPQPRRLRFPWLYWSHAGGSPCPLA
jgi:hypothetical protein